jgi:hypothetical protein
MVLMAVWSGYLIFFKIPNEGQAYKARDGAGGKTSGDAAREKTT